MFTSAARAAAQAVPYRQKSHTSDHGVARGHMLLGAGIAVTAGGGLLGLATLNSPALFAGTAVGIGGAVALTIQSSRFRRQQRIADSHLIAALDACHSFVQLVDASTGDILSTTGDVESVTGWSTDDWTSIDRTEVTHADDRDEYVDDRQDLEPGSRLDQVTRIAGPDGEWRWLREIGAVTAEPTGQIVLRSTVIDTSETNRITNELQRQASRDSVTGLENRHGLEQALESLAVNRQPFALLVCDIRQFKAINDTLGHHIGDLVLTMMSQRLTECHPTADVYRLGADQFAIIIPAEVDAAEAARLARKTAHSCREPYSVGRVALAAPVAVGVAQSSANIVPSLTMRYADAALHDAKSRLAEYSIFHDDMQRFVLDNLVLGATVEHALMHNEFVLRFQPQVDLATGEILGAEGLCRWEHPERGTLTPNQFLEPLRLSAAFDRFSLAMVSQAMDAAELVQMPARSLRFSVNIEIRSLLSDGFVDRCIAERTVHELGSNHVVLELTETDLVKAAAADSAVDPFAELERLRKAGYEVAIDDFGTGASSLARLDRLPADELKIDRAFVADYRTTRRSERMLNAVIHLGQDLGMRVVAEGVETQGQAEYLAEVGCSVAQGFLYGKAMPLDQLHRRLLSEGRVVPLHAPSAGAA